MAVHGLAAGRRRRHALDLVRGMGDVKVVAHQPMGRPQDRIPIGIGGLFNALLIDHTESLLFTVLLGLLAAAALQRDPAGASRTAPGEGPGPTSTAAP
jgi:hypothetical protein